MKLAKVHSMTRYSFQLCFAFFFAITTISAARAEVTYIEGKDGGVSVIRMTVTPAPNRSPHCGTASWYATSICNRAMPCRITTGP